MHCVDIVFTFVHSNVGHVVDSAKHVDNLNVSEEHDNSSLWSIQMTMDVGENVRVRATALNFVVTVTRELWGGTHTQEK